MFIRIINADFAPVPWLSPEGRDLVARLLNPDPKARMTVTDALRHPGCAPAYCLKIPSISRPRPICRGLVPVSENFAKSCLLHHS